MRFEELECRRLFTIPGTQLDIWHTYTQATSDLNTIHNAYPNLTQLVSLGSTVQGRTIWAMEITDNPGVEEDEPEFLYNGPMHGDEPVGFENIMHFMQHLLENYGATTAEGQRVTNLVNNMDIWLIPDMNWDGYTSVSRYNAHGIDLNRNFPEWTSRSFDSGTRYLGHYGNIFDGPAPQTALLEPETVAVMNFLKGHSFVSSVNFHGGDLVVNYPWDTDGSVGANYAVSPDDALFREMALTYSRQNSPMFNQSFFPQGVTNGDDWYPISGGEQDWANLYTGNFQVTIELGYTKYPSASQLPTLWNNNKESMMQYMEAANWGVRGRMTDVNTGAPVFGKITLMTPNPSPTPDANHPNRDLVFSDPDLGDYHRMLLPGTYSLKFEANGYQPQTIQNLVVSSKTNDPLATVRLDVQMVPIDNTPPTVANNSFFFETAPNAFTFVFSEDIGTSLSPADIILENTTTQTSYTGTQLDVSYNPNRRTATITLPAVQNGALPDGNYRARLLAGSVTDQAGNPNVGEATYDFFANSGDANHDRSVNIADFSILAGNFNLPGTFSGGDFNYDGQIGIGDFSLMASKFNHTLQAGGFARGVGPASSSPAAVFAWCAANHLFDDEAILA